MRLLGLAVKYFTFGQSKFNTNDLSDFLIRYINALNDPKKTKYMNILNLDKVQEDLWRPPYGT